MPDANSGTNGTGGGADFIDPAASLGGGGGSGDGSIRDSAGDEFDGTIHSSPDSRTADGRFRKKRGRKSGGGGNSKSRTQVHSDIKETAQFLAQGLLLFHTSMAAMTQTPELVLDSDEAQGLAESGLTLAAMYDITPDPKLQAMIFFASQVGMIYGTRIIAIRARKSQEKKEKQPGTAGVYNDQGAPMGTTTYRTEDWPINNEANPTGIN